MPRPTPHAAFIPRRPILDEEDLRLLGSDLTTGPDRFSLRDLGDGRTIHGPPPSTPPAAPARQNPFHDNGPRCGGRFRGASGRTPENSDLRWLVHFAIIAIIAGLVAILFITVFFRF